jgi:hypothetical protein
MSTKFVQQKTSGIQLGGVEYTSSTGFSEVESITKNGNSSMNNTTIETA